MIGQSKIQNLKYNGNSAERAGESGQGDSLGVRGDSMRVVRSHWSVVSKSVVWLALSAMLFALCVSAEAQQPGKIPRIGFQLDSPVSMVAGRIEGFRQGLRELGYTEGENILIEWRSSEGKLERRAELAAEFVRLKVDVIVSGGPTVTRVVKEATSTIPIVMEDSDPVGNGFVANLARPGGNITGLTA